MKKEDFSTEDINDSQLLEYVAGRLSEADASFVEKWAESNISNNNALLEVARLYYAQKRGKGINLWNTSQARKKVMTKIESEERKKKTKKISLWKNIAAVAIIILVNLGFFKFMTKDKIGTVTLNSNATRNVEFILPDSSIAYLNSNSTITFPTTFSSKKREVIVEGEVFFKIKKDKKRPFLVQTKDENICIEVLGTSFNVQAYNKDSVIQTTLLEGSIALTIKQPSGDFGKQKIMTPLDQITINLNTNKINVNRVPLSQSPSWTDQKLEFSNTPINEVIRQIANYYNVKILIRGERLKPNSFTGVFENKELPHVLNYLRLSAKINYTIETKDGEDEIIILND